MASNHTLPGGNVVKVPDYGDAADVPASLKIYGESLESALVPIGAILPWGGATNAIPGGWLLCDGSTFSGTDYPRLQAVLGRTTTPNLIGRMPIGVDGSDSDISSRFDEHGSKRLTAGQAPVPSHNHTASVTVNSDNASHTHTAGGHTLNVDPHAHGLGIRQVSDLNRDGSANGYAPGNATNDIKSYLSGAFSDTHTHTINSGTATHTHTATVIVNETAETQATEDYLPPVLALNFIIRGR